MTTAAAPTGNLEITVSRAELLRELTAAQSVVERKTTIPILSNFLFEAADDTLTITATDLDQGLRTSCPAKVKKPGACTIPARKLYDYIKLLPEGDISIKLMDNHWVQIRAGRSNTKMVGMARANFPQVPEFPTTGAFKLSVASLENMISKTIFAISNEESRYTLNGALLVLKAESMAMVATDGHRLAHIEKLGESLEGVSGEKKTLIPRKALSELLSLLNSTEAETLDFADDEQTLFFRIGGRVLTSRKLTGQFPNYEAVLPRDNNKFVIVRSEDLMGCDPARRPVRRRALRRHQDPPRTERAQALLLLHRLRRVRRHHRDALQLRPTRRRLQQPVPARLPEGHRRIRRGPPGVQGCPVRRPNASRRRLRRRQVPLHPHAHAHINWVPHPSQPHRDGCGSPTVVTPQTLAGASTSDSRFRSARRSSSRSTSSGNSRRLPSSA